MSKKTNTWKLGAFVTLGVVTGVAVLVSLGAAKFDKPSVEFVTYFNESVQGLERGAKVKFRGVAIGEVTDITIAPDRRHVEVHGKVYVERLVALGLREAKFDVDKPREEFVPPDLRVQLVSASLATGQKFLQSEFFDVEIHPPPPLTFPTPPNYIPSVESTGKSVEELFEVVSHEFPSALEQVKSILSELQKKLKEVDAAAINDRGLRALDQAESVLAKASDTLDRVDSKLDDLDVKKLGDSGQEALDELNATLESARRTLDRIERPGGMLEDLEATAKDLRALELQATVDEAKGAIASVESTTTAITDLARDGRDLERELSEAAAAVAEAADSIRRLVDTLEREPDMLLKGRSKRDQ